MTTLAEKKMNVEKLALELQDALRELKKDSEARFENYEDALKYGVSGGLTPSDTLLNRLQASRDAVEGAKEGLKDVSNILANTIVWEDY